VTRTPSYRNRNRNVKPIRKDRVAIVVVVLLAAILIPVLIHSARTRQEEPLVVVSDGTTVSSTPAETPSTTDESSTETTAADGNAAPVSSETFLTHTVQDGETISDIASEMGVSVSNLLASNRLFGSEQLQPGRVLYASNDGIVHTIQAGQTLSDIARSYAVPLQTILDANDISANATIFAGDRILIPGVTTSFWADVVVLSRGIPSQFIWPLTGDVVSAFEWRISPITGEREHHDGIDIDVPEGTAVHAAASGKVYFYGEQPGYGNLLILQHANGFYTFYGHLSDSYVSAGQYVEMGQVVAESGNSGESTGPHLHFEIRNGEYPVDPERYLP
jgi:murein DD-endopeptidase MepM/ murein hydrolase activator NlpD